MARSRQVGIGSLAIGAALLAFPRLGRVADLDAREARLIALGDLAGRPGADLGVATPPLLFARAAANVGIAALLLRRRSPVAGRSPSGSAPRPPLTCG